MPPRTYSSLDIVPVRGVFASAVANASHVANDQVGGAITFPNVVGPTRPGQVRSLEVVGGWLLDPNDQAAIGWNLTLFRRAPTVTSVDDGPLAMTDANAEYLQGVVVFTAASAINLDNAMWYPATLVNGGVHLTIDDTDADNNPLEDLGLTGYLQAAGTWAPGSTTAPVVELLIARN